MPDTTPHGPDGFPLCTKCDHQIRSANVNHPGFCQECIAKGDAGDAVATEPDADDASEQNADANRRRFV